MIHSFTTRASLRPIAIILVFALIMKGVESDCDQEIRPVLGLQPWILLHGKDWWELVDTRDLWIVLARILLYLLENAWQTVAAPLTACPKGTSNSKTGSSAKSDCLPCPEGKYAPNDASATCTDCPAGSETGVALGASQCSQCVPGKFAASSKTLYCKVCERGKAVSTAGQTVCDYCPQGRYSVQLSAKLAKLDLIMK